MKKMITFIALAFMALSMTAQESTTVTVHVDGIRLEDLLTDEQKAGVTNLRITGSLAEEDYAYLRNSLFDRLDTLDLLDADIDTLPAHAFHCTLHTPKENGRRVLLPKKLKHLSDYSLSVECVGRYNVTGFECIFELAGKYPTLGRFVYNGRDWYIQNERVTRVVPSIGNKYCKYDDGRVYSKDGTVLYFSPISYYEAGTYSYLAKEGTRTIYANCYEGMLMSGKLIIPESVDSIGDRAFAYIKWNLPTRYSREWYAPEPSLVCMASVPPRLGDDVFLTDGDPQAVYVPLESIGLYEQAEGWKELSINQIIYADIKDLQGGPGDLSVVDGGEAYTIKSAKPISRVVCYSVGGQMLRDVPVMAETVVIAKSEIPGPYMLVRIYFDDGTGQVVKLSR